MKFPRSKGAPAVVIAGSVWDDVAEVLEWCQGLSVSAPLMMYDTPGGPLLSLRQTVSDHRAVIRIEGFSRTFAGDSAAFALPGGYYWGFVQTGTATTFPAATGGADFNAATYYTDRDATPVIVYNLLESGLVASHSLAAGTFAPCDDIKETTDVAANGSNYPVSNGMTFALYRFYGYSLGCL
jgi:hypothetical protein